MHFEWQYPEDPIETGEVTFGAEFKARGERRMVITSWDKDGNVTPVVDIPVSEAVCDSCNAEVQDLDPCVIAISRLWCWACAKEYVLKYLRLSPPKSSGGAASAPRARMH